MLDNDTVLYTKLFDRLGVHSTTFPFSTADKKKKKVTFFLLAI